MDDRADQMTELFRGVGVALVTLFGDGGSVDAAATGALAGDLAGRGMRAVLACGTTGEPPGAQRRGTHRDHRGGPPRGAAWHAGPGGHRRVDDTARRRAHHRGRRGRSGCGARLAAARMRRSAGVLRGHRRGRRPARGYRYRIPWVSAPGVPAPTSRTCRSPGSRIHPAIPTGCLTRSCTIRARPRGFISAADPGQAGAAGAILALANLEPERCSAAFAGDGSAQLGLAETHLAVRHGGPPALKRLLAAARGLSAVSRPS